MLDYLGWILGFVFLLDLAGHFLFSEVSFTLSLPILRQAMPDLLRPVAMVGQVGLTEHGKCKLVSTNRVLIRERYSFLDRGQQFVRLSVDWSSGMAQAKGGIPLLYVLGAALSLVFFAWDWHFQKAPDYVFVIVLLIGIAVMAAFSWYRVRLLLREYEASQTTVWSHT